MDTESKRPLARSFIRLLARLTHSLNQQKNAISVREV